MWSATTDQPATLHAAESPPPLNGPRRTSSMSRPFPCSAGDGVLVTSTSWCSDPATDRPELPVDLGGPEGLSQQSERRLGSGKPRMLLLRSSTRAPPSSLRHEADSQRGSRRNEEASISHPADWSTARSRSNLGNDPLSVSRRTKAARGAPPETNNSTSTRASG